MAEPERDSTEKNVSAAHGDASAAQPDDTAVEVDSYATPTAGGSPPSDEFDENADEETRLKLLTTNVRDQDDLERDIGRQADHLLTEQANVRDKKRLEKTEVEIKRWETVVRRCRVRLSVPAVIAVKTKIRAEIAEAEAKIVSLGEEMEQIQKRIEDRLKEQYGEEEDAEAGTNKPLPNESRRDFLLRTGKITPFSNIAQAPRTSSNLADVMLDAEAEDVMNQQAEIDKVRDAQGPISHQHLMQPGRFDDDVTSVSPEPESARPRKKRRLVRANEQGALGGERSSATASPAASDDVYEPDMDDRELAAVGESDEGLDQSSDDEDYRLQTPGRKRRAGGKKAKARKSVEPEGKEDFDGVDDGDEKNYQSRLRLWTEKRSAARKRALERRLDQDGPSTEEQVPDQGEDEEEWYKAHPTRPDTELGDDFRIPGDIYPSLFDYQKTGVKWLYELYQQQVGGIIGDEMGLGKTIQAISFLAGLHYSKKLTKPIIVVTPATVMKQWVNEFHRWWPPLRVSILHSTGSGMLDTRREDQLEDELEHIGYDYDRRPLTKAGKAAKRIVDRVKRDGHVLVTTYSGLQTYAEFLIPTDWEYAVLDEGHKIRNPDIAITVHCKELRTPNRIILSGTPMQNNLTELWSLFDFVFPMRLGTLVNFRNTFEFPIKRGGYANSSNLDFETAIRCAETLKDTISPYLLQRFKVDVATDLPRKTERVLFCNLTRQQRDAYVGFLASDEMKSILNGKRQMLFGVDYLRKVCNHPDLTEHKTKSGEADYGAGNKSGKMQVVKALLEIWKKGGHKTLLFAQQRIMLDILEKFVKKMPGFTYRRMDGTTPIKDRQNLVDEFNNDPDLHVFLLTTKVGGLGVNLTGADRVIIYDPDWNPSTDIQARERSWRLGQKKEVEIYRLMTAGTIEEKIYHRQIFKQFLTNKILKDPKQRQTFQLSDLQDLFTLGNSEQGQTETGTLFKGSEVKFKAKGPSRNQGLPTPPTDLADKATTDAVTETAAMGKQDQGNLTSIRGIRYAEDFRTGAENDTLPEDGAEGSGEAKASKSDDRLMSTIFARSGVHSALEHDAIMGSNSSGKYRIAPDAGMIRREAQRQANEAAMELKRAEQVARNVPIGTPTWTGTVGTFGRPTLPATRGRGGGFAGAGRGGPSSSSVLANLAARQGNNIPTPESAGSSRAGTPGGTGPRPRTNKEWIGQIIDFIKVHGGRVPSQMIVDHFNHMCRTERDSEVFKQLLRKVADLDRPRVGRARWVLKAEFAG